MLWVMLVLVGLLEVKVTLEVVNGVVDVVQLGTSPILSSLFHMAMVSLVVSLVDGHIVVIKVIPSILGVILVSGMGLVRARSNQHLLLCPVPQTSQLKCRGGECGW